jgi:hypothetical protein
MCNFEAPDQDVFTLYDNWETAVARFPHVSTSLHMLYSIRFIACPTGAEQCVYCVYSMQHG